MKMFIIHRYEDNKQAKKIISQISKKYSLSLEPIFLDCYKFVDWKDQAKDLIALSEIVIVFNKDSCLESDNVKWEIQEAEIANKEIIELSISNNEESISKIHSLYNMKTEFENCFSGKSEETMNLYNLMIQSSEQLIQRRQTTNAFFITVLGSLFTVAALLLNIRELSIETYVLIVILAIVGILLCNSWRNLIDNYGKLNKAKFDVILRLEKDLPAQIYSAEWIALGKGIRREKYKSFTSTEKNVPLYFGFLIFILVIAITIWMVYIQKNASDNTLISYIPSDVTSIATQGLRHFSR